MNRTRLDIMRDLDTAQRKLASNRKTADTTLNPKTAAICDAVEPSLRAAIADLNDELMATPEDRPQADRRWLGTTPIYTPPRTTPLSDAELAELEIPAFLRRA